jgi:hypothetical protein
MFRRLTRVAKGRARIFLKIGLAGFEQLFSVGGVAKRNEACAERALGLGELPRKKWIGGGLTRG